MSANRKPFYRFSKPLLLAAFAGLTAHLHATTGYVGVNWALRNPLPMNESLKGVACNGDNNNASTVVVVVGSHGVILSASASTGPWTVRASATTENINAVAWSQGSGATGNFVAVGNKGTFLTSPDGTTWTKRDLTTGTAPTTQVATEDLTCVTWTGGRFFVGGNGSAGAVVYGAVDPTTIWSKYPNLGTGTKIHSISGTGSSSVFAFTDTNMLVHSANALPVTAWTPNAWPAAETYIQSAVYTIQGTSVALVISGSQTYRSTNLTTWSTLTEVTDSNLNLTWTLSQSGPAVVGVGANGVVWVSPSGAASSWTKLPVVEQGLQLHAGVKFGTNYVVVGDGGRIYSYSGTAWTSAYSSGGIDNLTAVGVNGSKLVALAKNVSYLSTDNGTTWAATAATIDATSVSGFGSGFIATGNGIWSSTDGVAWTSSNPGGFTGRLNRVRAFGASQAIAVGADPTLPTLASLVYQFDGTTWTKASLGAASSNLELRGVAVSSALSVAVGDGGVVLVLPAGAGKPWAKHTVALAKGEGFTDVLAAGSQFLASTSLGGVWSSTDGAVWTKRLASSSAGIRRLVDTNNITEQFIGVGGLGTTIRSFGGSYWYETNAGTSQSFTDAVWASGTTLVLVGTNGTIMTSSGAEPPRPTLSFMAPTSSFSEAAGTVQVTVQLSSPSPLPVTVAYTGSTSTPGSKGLATLGTSATSDYSLPTPQVLTFPATLLTTTTPQTQTISVAIKQDHLVEGDEVATLTLVSPTGDAVLGTPSTHALTIVDDDILPKFPLPANQPQNQLVNVGSALALTATGTGNAQPTGQWKKNNVNVVGATLAATLNPTPLPATTTFTCSYSSALITQAGTYTLLLTNQVGTQLSNIAQVGVVDNTLKTVVVAENGMASLSVVTGGTGLTYQWMRANGGTPITIADTLDKRILGSRTAKLSIKTIGMLEADTYYCVVTQAPPAGTSPPPALTITGGTTVVRVVNAPPTVSAVVFPLINNVVSQAFDFTPAASFYPYKWSVTGLPPGLTFDATTGHITGSALRAGDYIVTFTATNAVGDSTVMTSTLTIAPMPVGVTGMFMGLLKAPTVRVSVVNGNPNQTIAQAVLNNSLGARLDLTVSDTSLFSGKLTYGTLATAFTGALTYNPPPVDPVPPPQGYVNPGVTFTGSIALQPKGYNAVTLTFTIFPSSCPTTPNTISVLITDGKENPIPFTCWRNMWLSLTPSLATTVSTLTGYYHFGLFLYYNAIGGALDPTVPDGFSFAAFTLASDGTLAMSGQMADGSAFASSGFVDATAGLPTVQVPVYAGLYSNTGAVNGIMTLTPGVDKNVTPNVPNSEYNALSGNGPGTLTWSKNIQTAPTRSYPGGFGTPSQLTGTGVNTIQIGGYNGILNVIQSSGRYTPPQTLTEIVMGLPVAPAANNVEMRFTDGGVNIVTDTTTNPPTRTLLVSKNPDVNQFTVAAPAIVTMPVATAASDTLNFVPSTGTFSGTFTLVDVDAVGTPAITRNVNFYGMILGHRNVAKKNGDGAEAGFGYFTLPKLPSAGPIDLAGGVRIFRSTLLP